MKNFLESYNGRLKFEAKIRALPSYLYRWGQKALKTIEMRQTRRMKLS